MKLFKIKYITIVYSLCIISYISNAQIISAGSSHSLFLCNDGSPMSSGFDCEGRLGQGTTGTKYYPNYVVAVDSIIAVSAGGYHSLFLMNDGSVWASGSNQFGQLGNGTNNNSATPIKIPSLTDIIAISAGRKHSIFLRNDSTVWTCGLNQTGQLGDSTNINKNIPVQITSLSKIIAISAGEQHSLFLKDDGSVWATGWMGNGQLGIGYPYNGYSLGVPIQIPNLDSITHISAGFRHSLFLRSDSSVWACGENYQGQLGDGTTTNRFDVVQVISSNKYIAIDAGQDHSIFLKSDSTVWACGHYGGLGIGHWNTQTTPAQTLNLNNVIELSAGAGYSLYLKNDSTVWACGNNNSGQYYTSANNIGNPVPVHGLCGNSIPLDIKKNIADINVSIYPNPSTNFLFIENKNIKINIVNVLDFTGKIVKEIKTDIDIININDIPNGIYFIKLITDEGIITKKFIKQ